MSDKKNIDRLFQERFKDFEATPPPAAWNVIEKKIANKKVVDKPVVSLWWRYAGVAVILAILTTVCYVQFNTAIVNTEVLNNVVNAVDSDTSSTATGLNKDANKDEALSKTQAINNDSRKDSAISKATNDVSSITTNGSAANQNQQLKRKTLRGVVKTSNKNTLTTSQEAHVLVTTQSKKQSNTTINNLVKTTTIANNDFIIEDTAPINKNTINPTATSAMNTAVTKASNANSTDPHDNNGSTSSAIAVLKDTSVAIATASNQDVKTPQDTLPSNKKNLEDAIATTQQLEDSLQHPVFKKSWSGSPVVAPVFSNTAGGSSINSQFVDNSKSTGVNLSYGVTVGYNASPKWTLRSGLHKVAMSYTTQDINYGLNLSLIAQAPSPNFQRSSVTDATSSSLGVFAQDLLSDNAFTGIKGEISQNVAYLEVPVEFSYKLVDKRFNVNVIGGMSALFLTDNSIAVYDGNNRLELGADSNFNEFNQSANLGLGLGYDFSSKLTFAIEPIFKYQLNALKEDYANFRPYNIGVYTGVTYTF